MDDICIMEHCKLFSYFFTDCRSVFESVKVFREFFTFDVFERNIVSAGGKDFWNGNEQRCFLETLDFAFCALFAELFIQCGEAIGFFHALFDDGISLFEEVCFGALGEEGFHCSS